MDSNKLITIGVAAAAAFVAYKLATDPEARSELMDLGDRIKDGVGKVADLLDEARGALDRTGLAGQHAEQTA